jgi:GNAT superfamily N-acetyltransferase
MPSNRAARLSAVPPLSIVCADDSHVAALADFYREVWDPTATPAAVALARRAEAATNPVEPGVAPPTMVALHRDRILGLVASLPAKLWDGEHTWPAYWLRGLTVLPEARNGPIGFLLLRAAAERFDRALGLMVSPSAMRLFQAVGFMDAGAIQNWLLPLAPERVLDRLDVERLGIARSSRWLASGLETARRSGVAAAVGRLAGVTLGGITRMLRLRAAGFASEPITPLGAPAELETLWRSVRRGFPSAVQRDAQYLTRRYETRPNERYEWLAVRERGVLRGIAIVRAPRPEGDPRLNGIRVAVISDLLYAPDRVTTGLALLGAVERAARRMGADAVLAAGSAAPLRNALRQQCYLPVSATMHLMVRDASATRAALATSATGWWVTRGDSFADEVF